MALSYESLRFQNRDESGKRDYLYYLAIGNARIKEYQTALKYVRALLQVQPGNRQAQGENSTDNLEYGCHLRELDGAIWNLE